MKTTIDLPDELLRRAKRTALERGTTLRAIVEDALTRALGAAASEPVALRTVTWGAAKKRGARPLDAAAVDALVAGEREGRLDDPDHWRERFGFVPPGLRRR
jgi:hypothetical protein